MTLHLKMIPVLSALLLTQCTGLRAWMFNYEASRSRSKPDKVMRSLKVRPGQTVADLGAGGGYFAFRFARQVGKHGRVYAIDINKGFLEIIRKGARKRKLANIKKRATPRTVDRIVTGLYRGLYVANQLCRAERLSKAYDDQVLFTDLSFEVQRGDRVVIVGPNGCGKTTLLRILTEDEEPDDGRIVWGKASSFVYYNQIFQELDLQDTVTHAVNITELGFYAPRKQVNRFLSLLQFSEMDLTQRIGILSGGQRARVALAKCLLSGAGLVILDEPTNHLDMVSTQVMERALVHFPGAIVVVSHDRFFIDKIATRMLVFGENGRISEVAGNWTIWQSSQGE